MPAVTSTNPKKRNGGVQNAQLPYTQRNQMLPVKTFTPTQLEQGSQNVMGTAQQTAIQKASKPNPTMGLVQQQTQQLLKEPELITDKYIKNRVGQYDRERANQMSAFQQTYADTANTGTTRESAYNFAMEGAQGKIDLENKMVQEQGIQNRKAKLDALNLGMSTAKTESGLDTEAFNRLISARNAYEGERAQGSAQEHNIGMSAIEQANRLEYLASDQEGQLALTELQGKIQKGFLLTEQDFVESQSSLDRALEDAKMKGDWKTAEDITRIKGDIDAQAQKTQQEWAAIQNSLDRDSKEALTKLQGDIQKGLLLTGQDFAETQNSLNRALEDAKMKGDWASAEKITTLKGQIDAQAQEAQQEWAGVQNLLDREGKVDLTKLQGDIQKGLLLTEQDFVESQSSLDRALEDAKMKGDWANAEKITTLKGQIDSQAQEAQQEWAGVQNSLDRENQVELTNLKGEIQEGLLIEGNRFAEIQNGLNRDLERYKAAGDWENAEKITKLKGQIDAQSQEAQREWSTSERVATQSWSTTERLSDQQFNRATQVLDQKHETALQENDINAMQEIEDQRMDLQLTMQMQDFTHDEKMTKLSADIAEAYADNNVGRQKQLIGYQSMIDLNEMATNQGYKVAQMHIQKNIQEALNNGQHTNAMTMLSSQQKFAAEEATKDRALEYVSLELQRRGVDSAEMEQRYNMMARENPDAAFEYLQGEMSKHGIKMDKADEDASLQAIANDYRQQQFVYALSHPDQAVWVDANGNAVPKGTPGSEFGGLKDEAAKNFNEFLNSSYYGPDGKIQGVSKQIDTADSSVVTSTDNGITVLKNKKTNENLSPENMGTVLKGAYNADSPNHATYRRMLMDAPVVDIKISNSASNKLSGVPAYGSVVNVEGRLMVITGGVQRTKKGRNKDVFEIMDISTGAKKSFNGLLASAKGSVNGMDNWAEDLP